MEPHPGVFVSKASTDDWESDPDVPGSEMHELVHADGVWAGLTRFTSVDGPVPWTPEQREVVLILEGSVRIEIMGGDTLDLGVGDLFSLSARHRDHVARHDTVRGDVGARFGLDPFGPDLRSQPDADRGETGSCSEG